MAFRQRLYWLCGTILLVAAGAGRAEDFPVYPQAVYDEALSRKSLDEAARVGIGGTIARSIAYRTPDPFAAVLAFYRGIGQEYAMAGRSADHRLVLPAEILPGPDRRPAERPSEVTLQQAFFILDGAADLASSKRWLMIARPIVGSMSIERLPQNGLRFRYGELRQETAIAYIELRR
jgi:hypothetical protein